MLTKVVKAIRNPSKIILYLLGLEASKIIPDNLFLKLRYRAVFGKKLNLESPQTFNEKLQWLKLHDRHPMYTSMVDKYLVRQYIIETIGEEYLIPLLGVYDSFDEIDFDKLPNQFVLKTTHDSKGVIICRDKQHLDIPAAKKELARRLKRNFFYFGREWPYKGVRPRIICEKYMVDESETELKDYKVFCFDGEPKAMYVATDRGNDTRFDFFDMQFNHLPIRQQYKNASKKIIKPEGFDEMVELAKTLSKGIPHVRVDFYDINGRVYFGELTFYHFSGFVRFEPQTYDEIFGSWINLPMDEVNNVRRT